MHLWYLLNIYIYIYDFMSIFLGLLNSMSIQLIWTLLRSNHEISIWDDGLWGSSHLLPICLFPNQTSHVPCACMLLQLKHQSKFIVPISASTCPIILFFSKILIPHLIIEITYLKTVIYDRFTIIIWSSFNDYYLL